MKRGDVVTIAFPQSDGQIKHRPAILLKQIPPFDDWVVCPVSTQLRHEIPGVDLLINSNHPDFAAMGLKKDSVIRVAKLYAVPSREIRGVIGAMNPSTFEGLIRQLTNWLESE